MDNSEIYYNVMFVVVLLTPLFIITSLKPRQVIEVPGLSMGVIIAVFAIICMGSMPVVWGTWGDREAYALGFIDARNIPFSEYSIKGMRDVGFAFYTKIISLVTDYKGWFYVTAIIYVMNYVIAARRIAKEYAFVVVLLMLCCFQFFSYGTNTIRAGFAGSFIILALSFYKKPLVMGLLLIYSLLCHHSMLIPITGLIVSYFVKQNKVFLYLWILCIILSFAAGSSFEHYFADFSSDERSGSYLSVSQSQTHYKMGFRWDFLAYSALPVMLGWYYINNLKIKSEFYEFVYRAYLIANSVWILVIRAAFTDRFAYLSWFMFPILLVYPLLCRQVYRDPASQRNFIVMIILGEFAFTYLMFVLYGGSVFGLWHR